MFGFVSHEISDGHLSNCILGSSTFLQRVCRGAFLVLLLWKMTSRAHYIDVACLPSGRASANFRPDESPHSAHLCTFSLVWISYVFLERRLDQMTSYNWSMCWLWLHCGWACAFTKYNLEQITSGSGHKCMLYCIAVGYNMSLQISCSTEWLLIFWTNFIFVVKHRDR